MPDLAVILLDQSASMSLADRAPVSTKLAQNLREKLVAIEQMEVRQIDFKRRDLDNFVEATLADLPQDRLAALFVITDAGAHLQLNERPNQVKVPVHGLNIADPARPDLWLKLESVPSYALINETFEISLRFEQRPASSNTEKQMIHYRFGNGEEQMALAAPGETITLSLEAGSAGKQFFTARIDSIEGELTLQNNRIGHEIQVVRDRLRVALISGLPHQGSRTWRDLLKSDPAVDLIHFTILRPPHKRGVAPANELALVRFPIDELFVQKLDEFDLLIFDRYVRRGVVPPQYIDNVRRYVMRGGAILISAGPDYATPWSLHRTPLSLILPARPLDEVIEEIFYPKLTGEGRIHPITKGLLDNNKVTGKETDPKAEEATNWGPWYRYVKTQAVSGDVLMTAKEDAPLLIVDRVGEGRVAQLLSDQIWLWARDVEGGGPAAELLRRLAHWLMQEPDLDERRLDLRFENDQLHIEQIHLGNRENDKGKLQLTFPDGSVSDLDWSESDSEPGAATVRSLSIPTIQQGLYQARSGEAYGAIFVGQPNDPELNNAHSAPSRLASYFETQLGRMVTLGPDLNLPDFRQLSPGTKDFAGNNWLGLKRNHAFKIGDRSSTPLIPPLAWALLLLTLLIFTWWREGRAA